MDIFDHSTLEGWISEPSRPPATVCGLDLRPFGPRLARINLGGCVLVGCTLDASLETQARDQAATVVPILPNLPFEPFRTSCYRMVDLYRGFVPGAPEGHEKTWDYQNYVWFMDPAEHLPRQLGLASHMFARLHDTSLEAALARFIAESKRQVVGFMGGHDIDRDMPVFRTVAEIARRLCRLDFLVVSGGGPGLMEAANLGAFLAPFSDGQMDDAFRVLESAPKFSRSDEWLAAACRVREMLLGTWDAAEPAESFNLGIPTWLYGHEPPNMFATHAAKLFYNSLREDGLVTVAGAGLIFGRGNAGTVQEVFQDATQNYYRPAGVSPTPMALLESSFWTRPADEGPDPVERKKPLAPLLDALAREKPKTDWSSAVLITDSADEVVDLITRAAVPPGQKVTLGSLWMQRLSRT